MNPFTKRRKSRFAFIATCLLALLPTFASTNIFPVSQFDGLNLTAASKINRTFRQLESMYATGMGVTTNNSTNFVLSTGGTYVGEWHFQKDNNNGVIVTSTGVFLYSLDAQLSVGAITPGKIEALQGPFSGDASGLTGLNWPAITNSPGITTNHQISGGHTLIISNGLIVGISQ